jgi:16S rRNA (adenine1518-N6/adenine1519-N6)-dimethyltransferase
VVSAVARRVDGSGPRAPARHGDGSADRAPARSARQRELGQNFLVDRNILAVIERLAEVTAEDVVLEVGGGPGVLSERLAASAGHLHVIEKDERLRESLLAALAPFANVDVVFADALALDLGALDPPPGAMVANLPYGIAATLLLRTIEELPSLGRWVVMVQREVGERLAAAPGTPAYGVPSVLAQLSCEVKVLRPVSRHVFRPVPNVDSVLLGMRRLSAGGSPGPPPAEVGAIVHAAFAHRRKALAGSLALSLPRPASGAGVRERAREALVALGHPADARAERLAPGDFVALTRALGVAGGGVVG